MALVKLTLDGRRVVADTSQTILEVARLNGIHDIPTLCHDDQLEPFASCFLCVVKVKGARTLLPACSTKVTPNMEVETDGEEVRKSRKAALELILSNHHADCLGPCRLACPAEVDIQGYLALAALGKHREAIRLVREANPLPSTCGRVCTRPCEVKGCRRSLVDEPVAIDAVKRYLADLERGAMTDLRPEPAPPTGRKVAVIGAGPAGLSASWYLALKGHAVTMFEALPEAGGMLRYGIPEYRLPKDVLDLEIDQVLGLGVTLKTNTVLGKDMTITALKEQGFEAIYLGLGAWQASPMRVPGEDAPGVLSGIEFLKQVGLRKPPALHGTVLTVGGGNTAIDCARTALRLGAKESRILYRRTKAEMPANREEIEEALKEGVAIDFLVAPVRVITADGRVTAIECLRMELGEPDASGRRSPKPVKGSEYVLDADFILSAIGQATRVAELSGGRIPNFLPQGETLNLTRWQTIQVGERTGETSVEGVFAGGDVVTGAATVIEAIAAGRHAAHAIDRYLVTGKAEAEPRPFNSRKDTFGKVTASDLPIVQVSHRHHLPSLPVEDRLRGFAEVEGNLSAEEIASEVTRCLECGCAALPWCDLRKHATDYGVDPSRFLGAVQKHEPDLRHPHIAIDRNKCILCGRCVRTCQEVVGLSVFGFFKRGFDTTVEPPQGLSMEEAGCISCGLCVESCPTGALLAKTQLPKPGPWNTTAVPTVCSQCGAGCQLNHEVYGDTLVRVSKRTDVWSPRSNHCARGYFDIGHVQHRDRLKVAKIRAGRHLVDADLDDALDHVALRLKEVAFKPRDGATAVFLSPRLTNEEAYLAQKLARMALRTHHVGSFASILDEGRLSPDVTSTAGYRELAEAQVILLAQADPDGEHFAVGTMINRAIRAGGKLVYVHPDDNRLTNAAEVHVRCNPGMEAEVARAIAELASKREVDLVRLEESTGAAAEDVRRAADQFERRILRVVVFHKDRPALPGADRTMQEAAGLLGAELIVLRREANAQGLDDLGCDRRSWPGYRPVTDAATAEALEKDWCVSLRDIPAPDRPLAQLLREKKVRVAVVIGEDPVGDPNLPDDLRAGLMAAELLVVASPFFTDTARMAHVVLPIGSTAETSGTMTSSERRVQRLERAVPPVAGRETWEILCGLGARLGYRFKMRYASPTQVFEEIQRVVPIYATVQPDGREGAGIWDQKVPR